MCSISPPASLGDEFFNLDVVSESGLALPNIPMCQQSHVPCVEGKRAMTRHAALFMTRQQCTWGYERRSL